MVRRVAGCQLAGSRQPAGVVVAPARLPRISSSSKINSHSLAGDEPAACFMGAAWPPNYSLVGGRDLKAGPGKANPQAAGRQGG